MTFFQEHFKNNIKRCVSGRWIYHDIPWSHLTEDTLTDRLTLCFFGLQFSRESSEGLGNVREVNRITLAAVVTSGSGRQLAKGGVQCARGDV